MDCKHEHDEACGYVPATAGTPCAFVCEVCNAQDSGDTAAPSDAQPEECICETLCTGEEINGDCPVCGAEGAEPTACKGLEAQPATLSNALPVTALAAAPSGQVLYVGGVLISTAGYWTTDSAGNVTQYNEEGKPSNNYIHYNTATNTLTLHNATIKESVSTDTSTFIAGAAIGVHNQNGAAELTIQLEGTNTIAEVGKGIYVLTNSTGGATLTITGSGSMTASASQTGIWVQSNNGNGALFIQNAKVEATGTSRGVNVQSRESSTASLTVDGGSLTASGSPGILYDSSGSGTVPNTTTLTISNSAIVDARGGGIGAGYIGNLSGVSPTDGSVGIVFGLDLSDSKAGTVYGSVELQENLTIGEGESLNIPSGASLTIPEGTTLTVNGGELKGNVPQSGVVYKVTEVKLDKTSLTLDVNESETLTATITPDNATNKNVTWESSNTSVATVDADGKVTAVDAGTATITVTTADGDFTDTCTVTVNPVQYTVTVQTDGNGTASASPATAPAGTTVTLTADPDSGYHFERWEIVSGGATISGNQFTMPAEHVTVKAVFDRNSSSGGSSGGSSYREREYDFWMDVRDEIRHADPGDTVKANARTYDRMPWSVMEALRNTDNVTLHITWNGGEDIIIPSAAALNEQNRIYYPLSYLEDMTFEAEPKAPVADPDKVNPETGGILEVTAPAVTTPAGEPEVTAPQRGLAETPELAEEGVEQTLPGIYEPEETVTTSTTEESGTSGLWIAGVVAVLAAAAGGGVWFWKRKKQA
ncbi:Ig-like domain-containing protein [Oscillospiraceae bacterium NSJ-64]|uniref:Ig-like domain-containing protein n=1 Tax=Youxingia wuxianensis TaxID=2763678 RepID=A0A926ERH0_9FIRM|nr:Ig-like domain-containing protein [Youxingia wuxianensis]